MISDSTPDVVVFHPIAHAREPFINGKQFDVTAELEDGRTVTAIALQPGLMVPPFLTIQLVVSGDVEGLDGS